ncbi:MAG: L-fucose:H+ symporter permease [Actinomycetaceae bacterium]|nr:L-fucose:H+ symporter permease [Actinomycetaceae bacterium]MDY6082614.1 L-fucose:H+ symporter permease [Actinomycetaceae bacterium]
MNTNDDAAQKDTSVRAVEHKTNWVHPGVLPAFVLIVTCFAAWGISTDLTAPMVKIFSTVFDMSAFQSALVQFAYYGAYFLLAIPAAMINSRLGYKGGVSIGMGLAAIGAFLFFPAAKVMTFPTFLAALFILAGGLSIVETSANPFVMALGPEENATRRLNFAQAFNPIGSNIGVLMATLLVAPHIAPVPKDAVKGSPELLAKTANELSHVIVPYIALGIFYAALAIAIFAVKIPRNKELEETDHVGSVRQGVFGRLWHNGTYRFGVIAQFFNIAAQTCIWTYIPFYVSGPQSVLHMSTSAGTWWLQISLIFFLVMRFLMVWLMGRFDGRKLMVFMCGLGIVLTMVGIVSGTVFGALCMAALSGCISLLFPTIYGISLTGLGADTKYGSSGLVMAIIGGAIAPLVQGRLIDAAGVQVSFTFVVLCFAVVLSFGLYALKHQIGMNDQA